MFSTKEWALPIAAAFKEDQRGLDTSRVKYSVLQGIFDSSAPRELGTPVLPLREKGAIKLQVAIAGLTAAVVRPIQFEACLYIEEGVISDIRINGKVTVLFNVVPCGWVEPWVVGDGFGHVVHAY